MKTVRLLLLVMLALVLPLRGALANVTWCMDRAHGTGHAVSTPHEHGSAHGGEGHAHGAEHAHGDHGPLASHDAHTQDDPCAEHGSVCAAACAAPPILSAPPVVLAPVSTAAAPFPALTAPPPSHPSEGQERPPRAH
ncbi:MAG: hypothetical protein HY856_00690 [Burkholderiales bacterium]|nr:hypothetical protein [Burkholderiales bacterium]